MTTSVVIGDARDWSFVYIYIYGIHGIWQTKYVHKPRTVLLMLDMASCLYLVLFAACHDEPEQCLPFQTHAHILGTSDTQVLHDC